MAITRTIFDQINDNTETEVIAALRKGRGEMEALMFDDLDDANQALEDAIKAGTADDSDKTRLDRAKKLHDRAVATGDPTLAQRAKKALQDAGNALREKANKKSKTAPAPEPDEGEPKNVVTETPRGSNADDIASKVLAGINPFLATDKDGKPAKAASKADLDALKERVDAIDGNLTYLGFTDKREDDGRPIFAEQSWATHITTRTVVADNTVLNTALAVGGGAAAFMFVIAVVMQMTTIHNTIDVAIMMVLMYAALGFVVGGAIGAIIGLVMNRNKS